MMFSQDIDGCLSASIGAHGLEEKLMAAELGRAEKALERLRAAHEDGSLPLLHLPARRDDLATCHMAASRLLEGAQDIVLLGTGGSSLGAQALAQLGGWRDPGTVRGQLHGRPRFHFFDNLDGGSFIRALNDFDLEATRFVAISKSGSTAETMMQVLTALAALKERDLSAGLSQYFLGLAEPGANPMRRLLESHGIEVLDHDPKVGGRYSVLSNVGMLPAYLLGLDAQAVRAGAARVLAPVLAGVPADSCAPALGAAVNVALARRHGVNITILLSYADRLERFSKWFVQLWSESLGKDGQGTTPVAALGPVDQHSQLQLFLGGPRDKLVSIMMLDVAGSGPRIDARFADDPDIGYLAGRTIGDLVDCEQRATARTLMRNGRPVRVFRLNGLDEETMGGLFMHFMLETIIAGHLMGVNPFDQPAVEEGKILARQYLAKL
ncbi:MAG TPA: glucose-6-phosphate isomerase [Rhodobacteraceae bacterium]|nr:glucose-6-phosphate isomerase [Paracoccaceae bacterium]